MEGRLIVENFGPLKKVDIKLNKLMVLIGPQSGGKSTIAKLLAIFNEITRQLERYAPEFRVSWLNKHFERGLHDYNIDWDHKEATIGYYYEGYAFLFSKGKSTFTLGMNSFQTQLQYIPAERIFISMASGAFFNLQKNNVPLPGCVIDFGASFETSRNELSSLKIKELGITYRYENGNDLLDLDANNTIKLKEGSSGFQTMIPMTMVVEYFSKRKNRENSGSNAFIIEEPELNLYPTTQKKLVDFLADRCVNENNSLLVTTHSPYVLSAFANLIKANEVAKQSDEKRAKIKKVVPERLWLEYDETSAYFIDKGVSKNIMDKEFKTIDFSKIDKASDLIGDEFDKLLSIEIESE